MPHFSPVVRMCAHGCPVIASSKLICLPQRRVTGPSVSHNRKTTPSYAHTESHLPYSQMGLCPPSPDKLSLGLQINIQAKQRLYIIESWCHECTTGATLDAVTMCAPTHTDTHTLQHQHLAASCAHYPVCWLGTRHEYTITALHAPHAVLWWVLCFLPVGLRLLPKTLLKYTFWKIQ